VEGSPVFLFHSRVGALSKESESAQKMEAEGGDTEEGKTARGKKKRTSCDKKQSVSRLQWIPEGGGGLKIDAKQTSKHKTVIARE